MFKDGEYNKTLADGSKKSVYMVFFVFNCIAKSEAIKLNEYFAEYRWVAKEDIGALDLNVETRDTVKRISNFG